MPDEENQGGLTLDALSLADAARLLSAAAGRAIGIELLQADVAAGAPTNPDGTLHLVHYASWLVGVGRGPTPAGGAGTPAPENH